VLKSGCPLRAPIHFPKQDTHLLDQSFVPPTTHTADVFALSSKNIHWGLFFISSLLWDSRESGSSCGGSRVGRWRKVLYIVGLLGVASIRFYSMSKTKKKKEPTIVLVATVAKFQVEAMGAVACIAWITAMLFPSKKRRKKKTISASSCMLNSPLCPEGHGSKRKKKGKEECARSERKKQRDTRWMARFEIHATTFIVDDQLSHVWLTLFVNSEDDATGHLSRKQMCP